MRWHLSHCQDDRARALADRHYSREKAGTARFVAPGSPVVLLTEDAGALWVSLWQKHAKHAWPQAWNCTMFRNESREHLSSELITEAVAATRALWGDPPAQGFVTFVDEASVRHKRDPGRCFIRAGWELVGRTSERGHLAFQLPPERFPAPVLPRGTQLALLGGVA